MRFLRFGLPIVATGALVAAAPLAPDLLPARASDRAEWRTELRQVETHLATAYANFEWTVAARSLDLPALHRSADSAIAAAPNRRAAQAAIRTLLAAFDDGHLHASRPAHPLAGALEHLVHHGGAAPTASTAAAAACRQLGFENRGNDFGIAADELPGFTPVAGSTFRAGVVPHARGRVGVIRIPLFGESGYRSACAEAWRAVQATGAVPCDSDCGDAVYRATSAHLLAEFAETLRRLDSMGATLLVVDLTGNGGGSNLADAMARTLTSVPLRSSPVGVIRHAHPRGPLAEAESLLAGVNPDAMPSADARALVDSARARVARVAAATREPCDLSPRWSGHIVTCTQLVRDSLFATGPLSYAAPGSLDGVGSPDVLFDPAGYPYREGVWRKPLVLVLDGGSASATEQFAALLADNGAARVVGERSMGAGCGYTYGGIRLELPSLDLTVRAPDCARFRASGENERAGIAPDIEVPLSTLSGSARAEAVLAAATRD